MTEMRESVWGDVRNKTLSSEAKNQEKEKAEKKGGLTF